MPSKLPLKKWVVSAGVSLTSYEQIVELCREWAAERQRSFASDARYICVTSVHGIMTAYDDPYFAAVLNAADIVTPDGMPLVWALRSFGAPSQQRVYGPTLMLKLCASAAEHGHRIFLYGSRDETLLRLRERLCAQFPGIVIAGAYAPPFHPLTENEKQAERRRILDADPDLIFVSLGTPKQERWMFGNRSHFRGSTLIAVGAAFDFLAGRIKQAPPWMQQHGLEWLFRLLREPGRLWRRYLLITPRFLPLWMMQKWRSRPE